VAPNYCWHVHPAFGFVAASAEAASISASRLVIRWWRCSNGAGPADFRSTASPWAISTHRDKARRNTSGILLKPVPVEAQLRRAGRFRPPRRRLAARPQAQLRARNALLFGMLPDRVLGPLNLRADDVITRASSVISGGNRSILSPLAASALRAFVESGRHHVLARDLCGIVARNAGGHKQTMVDDPSENRGPIATLLMLYRAVTILVNRSSPPPGPFSRMSRYDPSQPFLADSIHGFVRSYPLRPDKCLSRADSTAMKRDLLLQGGGGSPLAESARISGSRSRSFVERSFQR